MLVNGGRTEHTSAMRNMLITLSLVVVVFFLPPFVVPITQGIRGFYRVAYPLTGPGAQ